MKDATATQSTDPFCLTHNTHSDCVLNYEIMNNNDESIQNGTWYANGFLFNLFTGAGQEATDKLRLNRNHDIVNIGLHFILKNVRPYAAPCSEA